VKTGRRENKKSARQSRQAQDKGREGRLRKDRGTGVGGRVHEKKKANPRVKRKTTGRKETINAGVRRPRGRVRKKKP